MYSLCTKCNHFFDIHLILGWKSSAIEHIPSNEQRGNLNQLLGWIIHGPQREVLIIFLHNILKESVQKKREEQENVSHIDCSYPWRKLFVLPKMLEDASQVRCNWHQDVHPAPQSEKNMSNMQNMQYMTYFAYSLYFITYI